MTSTAPLACAVPTRREGAGWSVAGLFLEALARRDFAGMGACLAPTVHFRALVPPGPIDVTGVDAMLAYFTRWFGARESFDVVDASIGQVGPRLYLRWRVRVNDPDRPGAHLVVEQHVFARAGERIDSLELLCSGFQAE